MLCVLLFSLLILSGTQSARILGLFPIPSLSHQLVFSVYMQELAKQGHDVVVITTNPIQIKNDSVENLIVIDISHLNTKMESIWQSLFALAKRGVIIDTDTMFEAEAYEGFVHLFAEVFKTPEVKSVIEDKNRHFDLIIIEALMNYQLIASKLFNAPVILFSTFFGFPENLNAMGAVSRHPILYPSIFNIKFSDFSTWDTLKECYNAYKAMKKFQNIEELENALLKENFGANAPTMNELRNNVISLLLNSHPLFADNRPVPPGVVYLGGLHLKPVKELPQDLKSYLDNSKRGVVYVSFGSNIRPELMHKDLLDVFLDAFEALPYDVLWKYNGDLERMPKNLKIQKWFPQRDLLTHPNVKVFVTQGGLQSTDEAIDAGVPLLGIPLFADQSFNSNKYVQLGIGMRLDALTLTANNLTFAIKTIISNGSFREKIKNLREIISDQPQRPLERAVWWTEHVLRHGGAHLKSPAANMSLPEYLMLDIFIPILAVLFILFTIISFVVLLTIKSMLCGSINEVKIKRN